MRRVSDKGKSFVAEAASRVGKPGMMMVLPRIICL
jgi:hypothetical protein